MRDEPRGQTASRALRRQRAARRRARRLRLGVVILALASTLAGFALGRSDRLWLETPLADFPLREVRVARAPRLALAPVLRAAGATPGAPALAVDRGALARRLEDHPWVRSARVAWLPPATLLVGVEEREPAAWTGLPGSRGEAWVVDREGVAFDTASPAHRQHLPEIICANPPERGAPDPELRRGLELLAALASRGLPAVRSLHLAGRDPTSLPEIEFAALRARVILGPGAVEVRIDHLAQLLRAELPETSEAASIDLRFEQRVVLRGEASRTGASESRPRADVRARCNRGPSGDPGLPKQGVRGTCHERTT